MAYYMQLPTLSEVVPADILHDKRFAQFAPYSATPLIKQEPASPAWSSYDIPSPGSAYSHGSRTPSLSPSPPPIHAQLPGQNAVWISQTAASSAAQYTQAHGHGAHGQTLVWMPTNMNYPAPCEPNPTRKTTPTPPKECHAQLVDPKQNYKLVASDPAHSDAIVHVSPVGQPKLLIGTAARQHLLKLTTMPENQRGKVVFYKIVRNA